MTKQTLLEEVNKLREESQNIPDGKKLVPVQKWYWHYIKKLDLLLRVYLQGGKE